jgi:hypothetical protein
MGSRLRVEAAIPTSSQKQISYSLGVQKYTEHTLADAVTEIKHLDGDDVEIVVGPGSESQM